MTAIFVRIVYEVSATLPKDNTDFCRKALHSHKTNASIVLDYCRTITSPIFLSRPTCVNANDARSRCFFVMRIDL